MKTRDHKHAAEHKVKVEGAQASASAGGQTSLVQATVGLEVLKPFINRGQMQALWDLCRKGEEKAYFQQKVMDIAATIKTMPKTYEQDGMGLRAVAYLHYFTPAFDFYITEKDRTGNGTQQAFGLACAHEREIGYISIRQLVEAGAELDLHWTPKTLIEIGR
ncbi:MAG: hypothetical protein M0Z36_04925 [Thermaerobacter sp.]|nr:hypothetical protein [Thermaerobacter sp.]